MHEVKLSDIQEQFYLSFRMDRDNAAYNLASLLKIPDGINPGLFEKTINLLIFRHEMLRVRVTEREGETVLSMVESVQMEWRKEEYSDKALFEEINKPFDLDRGALWRVCLFNSDGNNYHLLFVFHHIIFDLRSKELFAQEFCEIYNALAGKREPLLPPARQYGEYIDWYERFARTDKFQKMLSYWEREPLEKAVLNLPGDKERQPVPSSRGERLFGSLPRELRDKVYRFCRDRNSDPFLVLLTAYAVFLNRYSGQDEFSIGIPRTNRPGEEFHSILGCFVNILPLCLRIGEDMTFGELLMYVRRKMLGMHRNQNVPYLEVVKLNKGKRDAKYNPLFQVGFTFEHPMAMNLDGLDVLPLDAAPDAAQLDLFFYFWEEADNIRWAVEYCTDLFDRKRVEGFRASFLSILESGLEQIDSPVASLPVIAESSLEQISLWNKTDREYHISGGIHREFLKNASDHPEKTALIFRGESLTYGELSERVNSLAAYLIEKGVGRETIVGLSLERSFEMVIGMYAIVLAGGTYLPIEPTLPAEYIDYIRENSRLSLVLSKESYRNIFPGIEDFIALDTFDFSRSYGRADFPETGPDDRVYILYTSGSTGRPKGVEITHRGLINRILWMDEEYRLKEGDRLLQKTPYNFDVSGWEFWWPLMKGVPLVIAEPEGHKDNTYLIDIIERERITLIHFVPSMLREFLNACRAGACPSLREVICSGEALPAAVVRDFYKILPHARLHNLYGPTEASIDVTYWPCPPDCQVVPIGRPIANTKIHILDKALNPLPPGVTGEIYLAGTGLARGYLNKPELTAERFVSNPFDGGRMYKTGDLGQWNREGEILYLGRNDSQVQLHGLRIELGEIENALNDHPAVDAAAVIVRGEFGAEQSLVAYIVKKEEITAQELTSNLNRRLPLHMVPRIIYFLDEIPLSGNGKLDRKRLPDPSVLIKPTDFPVNLPEGERETLIAELWKNLLKLESVGRDENFFELGGTSIHIIQMQRELSKLFDRTIPVTDLFIHTTVKSLARYLDREEAREDDSKDRLAGRAERSRQAAQRLKNRRKR